MTDDLPFDGPTTQPNLGAPAPRTAHRHRWVTFEDPDGSAYSACDRCGQPYNKAASRRGRTNRQRGLAIQRKWLPKLGMVSIPGNGPADGRVLGESDWAVAQVKSGGRFSAADYRDLEALPAKAGRTRLLLKVETPGSAGKARATVTVTLADWIALHGPVEVTS